ncbi:MAG: ribonuclease H-like domain-containing protein [Candidatus Aenigmarchaeota archaeon]|nr:ribonuclease H-like domain-containing protein [Candidatus Aenigmarchaeota archaeon]
MADNPISLEICIIGSDYMMEDGKPVIRLWGKTKKGDLVLVLDKKFRPYLYVEAKPGPSILPIISDGLDRIAPESLEIVEKKLYGKPKSVIKVVLTSPGDIPRFKITLEKLEGVKSTYEYNIAYYKRYLIDKGILPMSWVNVVGDIIGNQDGVDIVELDEITNLDSEEAPRVKVLVFDLEAVEDNGENEIVVCSFTSNYGFRKTLVLGGYNKGHTESCNSEKELLEKFVEILKIEKFDIISGYNTDGFDFPLIMERAGKNKVKLDFGFGGKEPVFVMKGSISSFSIQGKIHIDLYNFVENISYQNLSTEVLSLDRVAQEVVGEGKKKVEWPDLKQAWKGGDKEKMTKYCERDSEITLKLSNVLLPQIFELSRVAGQIPFDTSRMTYSQLVEWLFIRRSFEVGELVPNRPGIEEIKVRQLAQQYQGGYVYTPKSGLHNNIALFDFRSLYPSIIIGHNISPETLNCGCCSGPEDKNVASRYKNAVPEESYYFCINHKGFIPEVVESLIKKRVEIVEKVRSGDTSRNLQDRQLALKTLANASYGYYGYPGSRWFSTICAKSITAWGRFYIKQVIDLAERAYQVIYGDTDSLFVKMTEDQATKFLAEANKTLPENLNLELRGLYRSCLFVLSKKGIAAKKRYALIDKKGDITVRGFESVRKNWSAIAKETQSAVISTILKTGNHKKAFEEVKSVIENIKSEKAEFKDLVIYTQLSKPLDEYEQLVPHVLAAKKAISKGIQIPEGSVIGYIITRGSGSISERAEILELAKNYDQDYYINNQIIPATLRILSEFGYTEKDFLGEKQESLDIFMNRGNKKGKKKFLTLKYKI